MAVNKATNYRASHLDFLGSSFLGVNVPLKDFSNKNFLLVKSSLKGADGSVLLPKAEEKYEGVSFLYRGDTQAITPIGGDEEQTFKLNSIYVCEKTGSDYEWAEVSFESGSSWRGAVDESETVPGALKDLPNAGVKVGDQYRVAKGGKYTTNFTVSPETKERAQEGDFFYCVSVEDTVAGTGAIYIKVTSGDDIQIEEIEYTSFNSDGELVDYEIVNKLGTADVSVEFFIYDSTNHKRVPIMADYFITPEDTQETGNKIVVNFNSKPDFRDKVIVKITAN